eukprot:2804096-Ditylum_brightwellii.AAC.1
MGHSKSGSSSSTSCKQYSRDRMSCRDPQATQLPRHFLRAMHLLSLSKQKLTTMTWQSMCSPRRPDRPRS